jgi:hypothetical protein
MRICDLNSGVGQLTHAFSQLKERWAQTRSVWQDDAARDFEKTHLAQIPPRLQLALAAVQRLAEVLATVERELDDGTEANDQ